MTATQAPYFQYSVLLRSFLFTSFRSIEFTDFEIFTCVSCDIPNLTYRNSGGGGGGGGQRIILKNYF